MSTSYVTPAQLSKWRLSHQCGVINETTDLTWISPVFPLRFCLFQDRVQDITLSSIVLSPWSPPSVTVSVLFFTTLTIWKTASRIFCGMSLNLGLPHAPPPPTLLDWAYEFWGRILQRWSAFLTTSYQGVQWHQHDLPLVRLTLWAWYFYSLVLHTFYVGSGSP